MKHLLKTITILGVLCMLLSCFSMLTFAQTEYIIDTASIVTSDEENELNNTLDSLARTTDLNVYVCTAGSLYGMGIFDYASVFHQTYGLPNDCILIIIYQGNLHVIEFGHLIDTFTQDEKYEISQSFVQYATTHRTSESIKVALNELKSLHTNEKESMNLKDSGDIIQAFIPTDVSMVVSCAATLFVVALVVFFHNSANKKTKATTYMSSGRDSFRVVDKTVIFVGTKHKISRDHYNSKHHHR